MKILAIDTATPSCSVCMMEGYNLLAELTTETKETHSTRIMPMIQSILNLTGLTINHIDGFAVTIGPGSFTGLRIGISTVKGLALATRKPIVGIRTSDALAYQLPYTSYLISTMIDARKNQVYCARFRYVNNQIIKIQDDAVLSPEEAVQNISEPCLFVGTGAILYQSLIINKLNEFALFLPCYLNMIRASVVATLSINRFEKNLTDDPASLVPFYIRKSDAELLTIS